MALGATLLSDFDTIDAWIIKLINHINPRPELGVLYLRALGTWKVWTGLQKFAILFARLRSGRVVDLDGSLLAVLPTMSFLLVFSFFFSCFPVCLDRRGLLAFC
jgi:hypothetical protein